MKKAIQLIVADKKLRKNPKVKKYIKFIEDKINTPEMRDRIQVELMLAYSVELYKRILTPPPVKWFKLKKDMICLYARSQDLKIIHFKESRNAYKNHLR